MSNIVVDLINEHIVGGKHPVVTKVDGKEYILDETVGRAYDADGNPPSMKVVGRVYVGLMSALQERRDANLKRIKLRHKVIQWMIQLSLTVMICLTIILTL